jgi:hypothetical protein
MLAVNNVLRDLSSANEAFVMLALTYAGTGARVQSACPYEFAPSRLSERCESANAQRCGLNRTMLATSVVPLGALVIPSNVCKVPSNNKPALQSLGMRWRPQLRRQSSMF